MKYKNIHSYEINLIFAGHQIHFDPYEIKEVPVDNLEKMFPTLVAKVVENKPKEIKKEDVSGKDKVTLLLQEETPPATDEVVEKPKPKKKGRKGANKK